jgi:glycosyltransferase involved in cell wall biosynthesis
MPEPSVFLVHNHYQQPGGEDSVVRAEAALLRSYGHDLHEYRVYNSRIADMSAASLLKATIWNSGVYREILTRLTAIESTIAHFHNTFPLISPAAYYAARRRGVAVVQTLHNYRLLCPGAVFFRDGDVCERCLGKAVPWAGVVHACYRSSRVATAAIAGMVSFHRAIGTWGRMVDAYIALTEFARAKFIAGGIPAEKIAVVPNFIDDPGIGRHGERSAVFVGRLAPEKGVETIAHAWRILAERRRGVPLKVIGDGPLETLRTEAPAEVEWLGWQPPEQVIRMMKDAAVLILPSRSYEGFPRTIVEAFATGLPVIGSRLGSIAEVIGDGRTGRLCRPGDALELAGVVEQLFDDERTLQEMGRCARAEYEDKYTPARHYAQLMRTYGLAAERARAPRLSNKQHQVFIAPHE